MMTRAITPRRLLAFLLCLLPIVSARRAEAWRRWYDYSGSEDQAYAVTIDSAGEVVAAGRLGASYVDTATVLKLDGATGEPGWHRDFDGTGSSSYYAQGFFAVATDAANDVVAGGLLANADPTYSDITVIKLAAADGTELWRQEINGYRDGDRLGDLTIDASGDVVAVGDLTDTTPASPYGFSTLFTVFKFAGSNGMELWRRQIGTSNFFNGGDRVAVDAAGDVVAIGRVGTGIGDGDLAIVKLAGSDGSVLWSIVLDAMFGYDVAVDGAGDVLVGGVSYDFQRFFVAKLAAATGTVLWRTDTANDPGFAADIAIDGADDVIVVGGGTNAQGPWIVAKLDGGTGDYVWSQDVPKYAFGTVAVDGAGDVLAGGNFSTPTEQDLAAVKLAGATGSEIWRQRVDGTMTAPDGESYYGDSASALAIDSANDVVAAGALQNGPYAYYRDFAVVKLGGLDGAVGPVYGNRLVVGDRAGDPVARRILGVAVDVAVRLPALGSAGDPTTNGATVTLQNPTTLESATLSLPAGGSWEALGSPPGSRGYKYVDSSGANGPCKLLLAKAGSLRVSCRGNHGPIPFSLDEPTQGALVLSVRLGAAEPQCMRFGGSIRHDTGTANPGPRGLFTASRAVAFSGACP
jgi:hypothetical protein